VAYSQIVGSDGNAAKESVWMAPADLYPQLAQDVILLAPGTDSAAAKALIDYLRSAKTHAVILSYVYNLPN
jgi:molybdate transport system substrate-binding protein